MLSFKTLYQSIRKFLPSDLKIPKRKAKPSIAPKNGLDPDEIVALCKKDNSPYRSNSFAKTVGHILHEKKPCHSLEYVIKLENGIWLSEVKRNNVFRTVKLINAKRYKETVGAINDLHICSQTYPFAKLVPINE